MAGVNAITFGVYGAALRQFRDQEAIQSVTLAGMAAGAVQVGGTLKYNSVALLSYISHSNGSFLKIDID